jgi:PII-like signaling protein
MRHDETALPRTLSGPAQRLTIVVGESDVVGHRPVYAEIVHRAHAAGLAGAAVFRGIEGYGASRQIHTNRLLSLSEDMPVSVVVVDTPDRIEAFLPEVEELVTEGLVMVDDVRVVRYVGRESGPEPRR